MISNNETGHIQDEMGARRGGEGGGRGRWRRVLKVLVDCNVRVWKQTLGQLYARTLFCS